MRKIVAVRKDGQGRITDYKLDDGTVLNHEQAVMKVSGNGIEGVSTFTNRAGEMSIRSNRGQEGYSLSTLPEF